MKIKLTILICGLLWASSLLSQEGFCGFDKFIMLNSRQESHQIERINLHYQKQINNRSEITIPIVVHVVWKDPEDNISTERILSQLKMLNDVFKNKHSDLVEVPEEFKSVIGNPSIHFCLASKDPNGQPSSGIIRTQTSIDKVGATNNLFFTELGGSTAWDTKSYLNIWITGAFGNTGFGIPPWLSTSSIDGIVLRSSVVDVGNQENREGNGRVCVHEIGHYLGLSHPWGNDERLDTACLIDDGLSDTPLQFRATQHCPDEYHLAPFSCGNNNMYVNFMDYSPDKCLSMFTQQQVDVMLNVLNTSRSDLVSNNNDCHNFEQDDNETRFKLFPNPTSSRVKISFEGGNSIFSIIEVFNLQGILVWKQENLLYEGFEIALPKLPQGIYIVKIGDRIQKLFII